MQTTIRTGAKTGVSVDTRGGTLRLTIGGQSVELTSDEAGAVIFALEQGDDELLMQRTMHAGMQAARLERGAFAC